MMLLMWLNFPFQLVNMGIELRDHVHEIEYLAIVAFVAREVQMSIPSRNPYTQFTPQDLEMAFAFQVKYGTSSGHVDNDMLTMTC